MELANVILALGGDRQNTVPKYNVTPAEIAVLIAIHGNDSVFDVFPTGDEVERSTREEIARLVQLYPARNADNALIVTQVYAGQNPILHTEIEDLGLDESLFKALSRVTAKPKSKARPKSKAKPAPVGAEDAPADNDATELFD